MVLPVTRTPISGHLKVSNYSNAGADWLLSYSSFQIIVEVNYVIVIVILSDCLNYLTPVFQQ